LEYELVGALDGCAETLLSKRILFCKERRFPESLRIWFIIAVTRHRCKPWSYTFEASNAE